MLISQETFSHTVYMGYMRGKYQLPAVQRFIQFVRRMYHWWDGGQPAQNSFQAV